MSRRRSAALWKRLWSVALRAVREECGVTLISQLVGLIVAVGILGGVTTVFDAAVGVSRNRQAATTTIQRAQNGLDQMVSTITEAVKGSSQAISGTAKILEVQVPLTGGGLRVVRFCLQTGANGGVLYQQMVYEATVDSSPFISQGLLSSCPDSTWTYNGAPSEIVLADRISNYQGSPTYPVFTYQTAANGGRQSVAIDLFVTSTNAPAATELTASVTPRLQLGPS